MDPDTRESLIARLPDHADRGAWHEFVELYEPCLLYTSPSPRDGLLSRMPSSA